MNTVCTVRGFDFYNIRGPPKTKGRFYAADTA
jgi:hypothetical protein